MKPIPYYIPEIPKAQALYWIAKALYKGWLTSGPLTVRFHQKLSQYLKTPNLTPLSSGTAALQLALHLADVSPGDEVILPSNTFIATLETVLWRGAVPILVDIDPQTWNLDLELLSQKITRKTKAVIAVPFAGLPMDMERLQQLALSHKLKLILDNAHALEATWQGAFLHQYADYSCYSFYATKNLTTAEGGLLVCQNPEDSERARLLSLHGMSKNAWSRYAGGSWSYDIEEIGYKSNLTDIHAAIGLPQVDKIGTFLSRREELLDYYVKSASQYNYVRFQKREGPLQSSCHLACAWLDPEGPLSRDEFMARLDSAGVGYSLHFIPLYRMKAVRQSASSSEKKRYNNPEKYFPAHERYFAGALSLPLYVSLKKKEIDRIIDLMKA